MSASPHTITGAWPPSSSVMRLRWRADSSARWRPTGTEPVKVTLRTTGEAISACDTSAGTP